MDRFCRSRTSCTKKFRRCGSLTLWMMNSLSSHQLFTQYHQWLREYQHPRSVMLVTKSNMMELVGFVVVVTILHGICRNDEMTMIGIDSAVQNWVWIYRFDAHDESSVHVRQCIILNMRCNMLAFLWGIKGFRALLRLAMERVPEKIQHVVDEIQMIELKFLRQNLGKLLLTFRKII